jgi:sugar/nucleoside kinase (ribokinase family)
MYDLVSIGTVVFDLFFKGESLTFENDRFELAIGGKYFVDTFYENLGGGATNVAVGAKKNGMSVGLAATIGDNVFKKLILEKLDEQQIDHSLSIIEPDYYNISAVLVAGTGDRTIVNYRSKNQLMYSTEEQFEKLSQTKCIYLANLPSITLDDRAKMLQFFKNNGIMTFSNIGVADCKKPFEEIRNFLTHIDVLIINCHEFAEMVRKPYEEINFKEYVKDQYLGEFKNLALILTDGTNGSYGYYDGTVYFEPAVKAEVVDATGAGDAYTAGFISEFYKTKDIQAGMKNGAKYSSAIVSRVRSN